MTNHHNVENSSDLAQTVRQDAKERTKEPKMVLLAELMMTRQVNWAKYLYSPSLARNAAIAALFVTQPGGHDLIYAYIGELSSRCARALQQTSRSAVDLVQAVPVGCDDVWLRSSSTVVRIGESECERK